MNASLTLAKINTKIESMSARSTIFRLMLVLLIVFSSGAQAWVMQPELSPAPNTIMEKGMGNMENHCQSQSENSDDSSCEHNHCSMCLIGVTAQTHAFVTPVYSSVLPRADSHSTDLQIDQLFRPPRFVV